MNSGCDDPVRYSVRFIEWDRCAGRIGVNLAKPDWKISDQYRNSTTKERSLEPE